MYGSLKNQRRFRKDATVCIPVSRHSATFQRDRPVDGKSGTFVSLLSSSFLHCLCWFVSRILLRPVELPRRRLEYESAAAIHEFCVAVEGKWVVPASFHPKACFQNRAPSWKNLRGSVRHTGRERFSWRKFQPCGIREIHLILVERALRLLLWFGGCGS